MAFKSLVVDVMDTLKEISVGYEQFNKNYDSLMPSRRKLKKKDPIVRLFLYLNIWLNIIVFQQMVLCTV